MFYTFNQSNVNGETIKSENLDDHVVIEAHSPIEANTKAASLGIYFDGVANGIDPGPIGDRWYRMEAYNATMEPLVYGVGVRKVQEDDPFTGDIIVHYEDGSKLYNRCRETRENGLIKYERTITLKD